VSRFFDFIIKIHGLFFRFPSHIFEKESYSAKQIGFSALIFIDEVEFFGVR